MFFPSFSRFVRKPITIVDVLEKAKDYFCNIQSSNGGNMPYCSHGMCLTIIDILQEIPEYNKLISRYKGYFFNGVIVHIIIPEFKRPGKDELNIRDYEIYWWDLEDITSRIKYLDDLIEKYKGDSTNIISKAYLNTVESRFKKILLSEKRF